MGRSFIVRVGKKGEIYTSKKLRQETGIRPNTLARARVEDGKLVIEPLPTLEELLEDTWITLTPEEAERASEKEQRKWTPRTPR